MKKFSKVFICFLLIVAMVLPTVGCGKKKGNNETIDKNTIYREEDTGISFPENFYINSLTVKDGKVYFTGSNYDGDYGKYIYGNVNIDGTDMFQKEYKDTEISWIDRYVPVGNGKAILCYSKFEGNGEYDGDGEISIPEKPPVLYTEGEGENTDEAPAVEEANEDEKKPAEPVEEANDEAAGEDTDVETEDGEDNGDEEVYYDGYATYMVDLLDDKGTVLASINMSEALDVTWVDSVVSVDGGNILVSAGDKMFILDENLSVVKKVENLSQYYSFFTLKDGSLVASYWGDVDREFATFDVNKMTTGDKIELSIDLTPYTVMQGSNKYDFYLRDAIQIYGYNKGDAEPTPILNFVNSDVPTSYFDMFESIGDNAFLGSYYDSEGKVKVCKYTKVNPEDVVDKEILTLGCMWLDRSVREDVIKFNKTNPKYRIVLKDYSIYQTEEDYDAGQKKFNADVSSGKGPDIILTNDMGTITNCMSKGLFVDLNKYLDNDPDIDKSDIFPNLLEAGSYNGKLYEIIPSFQISTVVGKKSVLNGMTSWTMDEFNAYRKNLPEGTKLFDGITRSEALDRFTSVCAEDYIDTAKAKCYFDSPEFMSLLEFIKELPESNDDYWMNYDYEKAQSAYRRNEQVLYFTSIGDIREYNRMLKGTFGEPVTMIGYPSKEGNGSSIVFYYAYAISSKCSDPEAAWQFIRSYLMKDYIKDNYWGIPASMSLYDEQGKEAMEPPYYMDGDQKIEYADEAMIDGQWVEIDQISAEEIEELKQFILSVTKTGSSHEDLLSIIAEDAEPFFEGQKSVEEVVKIIQSRASIYLNEKN